METQEYMRLMIICFLEPIYFTGQVDGFQAKLYNPM
jgi:hypothetical protein